MSVLSDVDLLKKLPYIIRTNRDSSMVNSASIDIRIGNSLKEEFSGGKWKDIYLNQHSKEYPYFLDPGAFVLVGTLEDIHIPNGYVGEFRLKSSRAREGFEHSLAFWVDPGWSGILTMELKNISRYTSLTLYPGLRIGQLILHTLTSKANKPYSGKYNNAKSVEVSKD